MKKVLLFCLLIIAVFVFYSVLPATYATATDPLLGAGTSDDPYIVSSGANLLELAAKDNFATAYVELAQDIAAPAAFSGFGAFGGTFDGKGHSILDFEVTSGEKYVGLFQQVTAAGIIKNLRVDATVVSTSFNMVAVAGIIAGSSAGTITDVAVSGTILGNQSVGGIAGTVTAGLVRSALSSATITGNLAGGIAGNLLGGAIEHCRTSGSVDATFSGGGGIVGNMQNGTLAYCYSRSAINKVDPEDEDCYIGHIAGMSDKTFSDIFYFEVAASGAEQLVGAFGGDAEDMPVGTLIDDICGKTSLVFTLNGFGEYWAVGTAQNDGYPVLRFEGEYKALSAVEKTYTYIKDIRQTLELSAYDYEGDYMVYYYGETFSGIEYALSPNAPINAGNYSYYAFPATAGAIGGLKGDYTIEKANLTAQYSLEDKLGSVYTGATQTLEILDAELNRPDWATLGLNEPSYAYFLVEGEVKTPVSPADAKDVGVYEVVATIEGGNNYHNLTGDAALVATLEITKATLLMRADDKYVKYGETVPDFTVSVIGLLAGETPATVRGFIAPKAEYADAALPTDVGNYIKKIIISAAGSAHNYLFLPEPNLNPEDPPEGAGSLYITKANISGAVFSGASYTYSGGAFSLTATYTAPALVTVTYAIDALEPEWLSTLERSDAGSYRILAKLDAGSNYNVLILSADLVINKADISGLALSDVTATYDGTAKPVSLDTAFEYDMYYVKSGVPSKDAPIAAGIYPIYAEVKGGANYNNLRLDAVLTINKMYVRVQADNANSVYGDALLSSFSISYSDASGKPYPSVPSSLGALAECAPLANAGDYPITVSVADTANFDAVLIDGVYTVEKAELIVSIKKEIVPYDSAIPDFTLNYSGFVASEDKSALLSAPIASTSAKRGDDTGEYYVELTGGEAQNYSFVLISGYQLVIIKTELTGIAFASAVTVYDGRQKTIFTDASGEYSITYNGSATPPSTVGKYNAALFVPESRNYYSYSAAAILTINKAKVTVTCNFPVVAYGDSFAEITLSRMVSNTAMTPELEAAIDASFECAVNAANAATYGAGSYPINVAVVPDSNLEIVTVSGNYTINKAPLTVTVLSKTYKYNQEIEAVTYAIVGFKNGEDYDALTVLPTLSAAPAKGDSVGVYPIYISGAQADNYTFQYIHGTVTIVKASFAELYILSDDAFLYDGTPKILDIGNADLSSDPVVLEPTFIKTVATAAQTDAGEYNVIITLEDTAGNYEFMTFTALMTILPCPLNVQGVSAVNKVYDATLTVNLLGGELYMEEAPFSDPNVQLQLNYGATQDKNAGEGKPVTTAMALTGSGARNYVLIQPTELTVDIDKAAIPISVSAHSRLYNGSVRVELVLPFSTIPSALLAAESDSVAIDFAASYGTVAEPDTGIDKAVAAVIVLLGADCDNYYALPTGDIFATITAGSVFEVGQVWKDGAFVPVLDAAFNGVYDKFDKSIDYLAPVAVFDGISHTLPLFIPQNISGVSWQISGDTATNAGTYTATITVTGSGNFLSETITVTYTIAPRPITVSGLLAADKVYDNTTEATLLSYESDVLQTSDVTITAASAAFAGAGVGAHIVSFVLTLTGADAANYVLTATELDSAAPAAITARPVTINGVTAISRVYDGTTTVVLEGGTLANVIDGELGFALGTGVLASADAGEDLAIVTTIALTGEKAINYSFTQPELTVSIAPRPITVSGLLAADKVYDNTTEATLLSYESDVLQTSDVTITAASAAFAGAGVGAHIVSFVLTLTGADAANYVLTATELDSAAPAAITARPVTINGVTAISRVYDGTTTVVLEGGTLANVIDGELGFALGTGVLASADAGEDLAIVTTIALTGEKAINYSFTQPELTVSIAPRGLTVTADSHTIIAKETLPAFTFSTEGLIETDSLTGELAVNTDGKKAGEYEITMGTLNAGNNYTVTYIAGTLTVKTPAYIWVIVGLSSAATAAGAGIAIFFLIKKKRLFPIKKSRELKE